MTEIVIDSSVLAKFLLKEEGWEKVIGILHRRPYTLDLAIKETANAIWRRTRLLGDISEEKAVILLNDLLSIRDLILKIESQELYMRQALKIALQYKITIYDALFITQACRKKATLVTADKGQNLVASKLRVNTVLL